MRWYRAITGAFAIGGVTLAAWGPRLPAIKTDLGVGTATIGLIVSGATLGAIVGLLLAPPLRAWLGRRRAILATILVVAAGLAVIGGGILVGSAAVVAGAFAVLGAALANLDVLINVEGSAVERHLGRVVLPRMHAAWSGGAALGAGIGAGCAALGVSPGTQMLGLAAVIALLSVVISRSIPPSELANERERSPRLSRRERIRAWLRGWGDPRLLAIGVVLLGVEFGEGSANNWLSLAVREGHRQSGAVAALLFAAFAVSEASARAFGGPAVDRYGRVRTLRATALVGILGVCLFVLAGSVWLVLLGVVLWAVGVSMGYPLGMSAAAQGGGNAAARVSVVAAIGYLASVIGPPVVGLLAQHMGLLSALWLIPLLLVATGVAAKGAGPVR